MRAIISPLRRCTNQECELQESSVPQCGAPNTDLPSIIQLLASPQDLSLGLEIRIICDRLDQSPRIIPDNPDLYQSSPGHSTTSHRGRTRSLNIYSGGISTSATVAHSAVARRCAAYGIHDVARAASLGQRSQCPMTRRQPRRVRKSPNRLPCPHLARPGSISSLFTRTRTRTSALASATAVSQRYHVHRYDPCRRHWILRCRPTAGRRALAPG